MSARTTGCDSVDLDSVIARCGRAIEADPGDIEAYASRGLAYLRKGEIDRAVADYDRALSIDPDDAIARRWRADALGRA